MYSCWNVCGTVNSAAHKKCVYCPVIRKGWVSTVWNVIGAVRVCLYPLFNWMDSNNLRKLIPETNLEHFKQTSDHRKMISVLSCTD